MKLAHRVWRAATALALLALAAACGGGEDSPAAEQQIETTAPPDPADAPSLDGEQLVGVWYEDTGTGVWPQPVLARFASDGAFALGGALDQDSWLRGTYAVEGQRIKFDTTGGACGSAAVFSWDVSLMAQGRLESVYAGSEGSDPAMLGGCDVPVGEPYNFTRVSPTSSAAGGITTADARIGPIGPEALSDLAGYWLVEGTGHLLRWDLGSRYWLDDAGEIASSPRDAGTTVIGALTVTFTSNDGAHGCTAGDVMVWDNVRVEDGKLLARVTADSCDRGLPDEVRLVSLAVDTP